MKENFKWIIKLLFLIKLFDNKYFFPKNITTFFMIKLYTF